jgi:Legionella pneumophila major outer membrane protein precursor
VAEIGGFNSVSGRNQKIISYFVGAQTMKRHANSAFLLLLTLIVSSVSPVAFAANSDDQVAARLDALEKENAALRARVNHLEASKATRLEHRPAFPESNPAFATRRLQNANALAAEPNVTLPRNVGRAVDSGTANPPPHFEVSGSLLYLQPGAGDLEYGTLISPLPIATPNWSNQSLTPKFSPTFRVGARYMPTTSDDFEVNWTHLNTTATASFLAGPTQMVGPPYLIGPESALYAIGQGAVKSAYDAANLDGGHTFCVECPFQLRAFGGVEFVRIGQNLSGLFQSTDGTASSGYTTNSLFTGAGPRLGIKGQYNLGAVQLIGEFAGAGLIGTSQSRINFTTLSPALVGINNQVLSSPNSTQVIPSIDARLATAYNFAPGTYGQFKIEVGYQAAIYFNAVSQYSLTQVTTTVPPVGVFLATEQHSQSSFTDQGPYLTGSWAF